VTPQPATGVFGRRVQEGDTDDTNAGAAAAVPQGLGRLLRLTGREQRQLDLGFRLGLPGGADQLPRPSGVRAAQVRGRPDQHAVRSRLWQLASQARRRHASRVNLPFRLHFGSTRENCSDSR